MVGITGLGSGINIDDMVSAIVTAERTPKQTQLSNLESKTTAKLTSLGQLKGAISSFQSALVNLNSTSSFLARTVSSSTNTVATGTATQSASAGSYRLEVEQLATGSKVATAAVTDSSVTLGTGSLTLSLGSNTAATIAVDSSNNSLAGIRDAINQTSSNSGINASIITDDQGARLVLTSTKTGENNDITISVNETTAGSSSTNTLSRLAYSGPVTAPAAADYVGGETDVDYLADLAEYQQGPQTLAIAQSAKFTVDGLSVTRDSNVVSDVVSGLSFTLKETGSTTLTVARDDSGVQSKVQEFVDAYNALIGFINTETKVTRVDDTSEPVTGSLVGDGGVRSLVNSIRSAINTPQGGSSALQLLADMGVTTQTDGTLAVDSDRLSAAISSDFEGVASYFTGDTGLAARLGTVLSPYTASGGVLESRTTALEGTLDSIDKQREALDARMESVQARLYDQYNAMDSLLAQLSTTSDSLTALFDSMPGFVYNSGN